ncbi:DeoR/GlpR family DNA-binding transcription regulator [Streptomyces sp. NBS 14/10]|uniref:DeoR/GlpR family DNA-binding transcription regulator n=1 Tax=Streptomyces sp. NBS 14/10 TaxID=1945643 RepID=UPI000B7F02EC|nr:DeoR/GlpR family DNA-binding transcription regulator [Streptomyces sp. NBS 14/10]KAK1184370.1 DeoR/GlpR family DNA-binding transcription regulator [Streptomyces sp. NBS 14/10]
MPPRRKNGDGQRAVGTPEGKPTAFAEERHARILQLLGERGRIRNSELAELLGVTEPTVRKDVADLARQQLLRRTHGGAMAVRPAFEPDLPSRVTRHAEAKTKIARACLELIRGGDAVFLDGGSTVLRIAELLAEASAGQPPRNINVLTNAIGVAQTLADREGIRHTVLGGTYRPAGGCFVGPLTLADLDSFTVNVAFIGVTGLSEQGFTVADLGEAQVKKAVVDRARRVVVAMDHSKLGVADFAKVCDIEAVGAIVTDEPNEYLTELCEEAGVELIMADDSAS